LLTKKTIKLSCAANSSRNRENSRATPEVRSTEHRNTQETVYGQRNQANTVNKLKFEQSDLTHPTVLPDWKPEHGRKKRAGEEASVSLCSLSL
jgi:hypothetical protein